MAKGRKYQNQNGDGTLTLIANGHYRDLVSWHDLPEKTRDEFDYVESDDERHSTRFVEYLGSWYDTYEFERVGTYRDYPVLYRWHGIQADSYFSGVVIRYSDDYESVTVGRYFT